MNALATAFVGRRFALTSPYSTEEIYRRLKAAVGGPFLSDRAVVGYFDRRGFQLRVSIWYGNSFQTILYGMVRSAGGRTRIECVTRIRRFVVAFMSVWFSAIVLLAGGGALDSLGRLLNGGALADNLWGFAAPVVMVGAGASLVYFGRWLARDEEGILLRFLEETLEAERA